MPAATLRLTSLGAAKTGVRTAKFPSSPTVNVSGCRSSSRSCSLSPPSSRILVMASANVQSVKRRSIRIAHSLHSRWAVSPAESEQRRKTHDLTSGRNRRFASA
jgi:hypothetical protein